MKHPLRLLFLFSFLCLFAIPPVIFRSRSTIVIRPENAIMTNSGVFEGWGTSLCWWANRLGYSDSLAQQSADLFFGADGLRFNIMRYNIGGGDDPSHTHITRTDSEVPGWLLINEEGSLTFDSSADARQLNVLKRAVQAAGEDALVEVFSNSPPYFMTKSGCSSGAEKATENNLKRECVSDFADYLARVAAYMQNDMQIPVYSLSPMNEPNTDYWQAMSWKQEGCHVDAGERQSEILEAAAAAMNHYGLNNVILSASDETSPMLASVAYRAYSPEAKQAVGRINTHTYSDKGAADLKKLVQKEQFNLWMSEVDGDGIAGKNAGEMGAALWLGKKIISDINRLHPSAWVMWQVVDNHISSEGMNGNQDYGMVDVNKGFWGAAVADHDNDTIILTQKYYGLGQFTRYIRPGCTLIPCGSEALAAYHPEEGTLSIVLMNTSDKETTIKVDLSCLTSAGKTAQIIRTSGSIENGEHWKRLSDLPVEKACIRAALPANSITTLIVSDVML